MRSVSRELLERLSMTFTANSKNETFVVSLLPVCTVELFIYLELFVFAMNSRRRYSICVCFIYGSEEKNSKSDVIFAVCRLPLTS